MKNLTEKFGNFEKQKEGWQEQEKTAREIASQGDFDLIEKELKERNLLDEQIERVKKIFAKKIDLKDFPTKNGILWEMLAIMELYDPPTAEHCVQTYLLAKEKTQKTLPRNVVLAQIIKREGVEIERFFLACLLHDIGKVEIPSFILNNTLGRSDWENSLLEFAEKENFPASILERLDFKQDDAPSKKDFLSRVREKKISAKKIVPVKFGISPEEAEELKTHWKIDPEELSLMDINDRHAFRSGQIIASKSLPVAAIVASQHHHKNPESMKYPCATQTLQVTSLLADILHLADVQQALESKRSYYKESFKKNMALCELIEHSMQGDLGKEITYLWVKDEYSEDDSKESNRDQNEKFSGLLIRNFLDEFENGKSKVLIDEWIEKRTNLSMAA